MSSNRLCARCWKPNYPSSSYYCITCRDSSSASSPTPLCVQCRSAPLHPGSIYCSDHCWNSTAAAATPKVSLGLSLSDVTLVPILSNTNGQAQELFPNVRLMDNSMLSHYHDSFKKHPYSSVWFDNVLRLENRDRWAECQRQRSDSNNNRQWRYFFHGTSFKSIKAIENEGLFSRSQTGNFGSGIYFSENLFAMNKVKCPNEPIPNQCKKRPASRSSSSCERQRRTRGTAKWKQCHR